MKSYSLLMEPWIPVRRGDGTRGRIAPWQITEPDPPLDIAAFRPDFKGALLEFLVGLMQTAMPPENKRVWRDWLNNPPQPQALKEAFEPLLPFFNLFGERPRFLQDLTLTEEEAKEPNPIGALLIDSPGENASRHNGDFFIKRDQPPDRLCPACAATALFALQAYAPSGGAGHRTSMRGGGPLTTLIVGDTLWQTVWSNVLRKDDRGVKALPPLQGIPDAVLPWAAATHDSGKKGSEIHSEGMHFLHHYWGMPRRVLLDAETDGQAQECPVCGGLSQVFVRRYWSKNYGNNYGQGWLHPLTPYREQGPGKEPLPLKGVSEGRGYNHWLGLVYGDDAQNKFPAKPAQAVQCFREAMRSVPARKSVRLRAFGYDMDNMKALNWCEGEYPVFDLPAHEDTVLAGQVGPLVKAADQARRNLVAAVKEALFSDGAPNAKADATVLASVSATFWARTESDFYARVQEIIGHLDDGDALLGDAEAWLAVVLRAADKLFCEVADNDGGGARKAQLVSSAYNRMKAFNYSGCSKILGLSKDRKGGKQ